MEAYESAITSRHSLSLSTFVLKPSRSASYASTLLMPCRKRPGACVVEPTYDTRYLRGQRASSNEGAHRERRAERPGDGQTAGRRGGSAAVSERGDVVVVTWRKSPGPLLMVPTYESRYLPKIVLSRSVAVRVTNV